MKKRRIIMIFLSIFSLAALFGCKDESEQETIVDEDTKEDTTLKLNSYTTDNYTFDDVDNKNGSVCYEIFVRSFYDTNGDGIGDFNGITKQLPYLKELGVKTLWLMPIMPSPTYHGYDVIDYYAVNPEFGTMEDFDNLLEESKKYNIDIMIDIVFNHSSTECSWFIDSYNDYISGNTSEDSKADWYCWSEQQYSGYAVHPNNPNLFYEARFDKSMPDINTYNEDVRTEMVKILKYWVEKGVDGFRFDAVKFFDYENSEYNAEFMTFLHDAVVEEYPGIYFVGECWDSVDIINKYYKSTFESFFTFESSLNGYGDATIVGQVKGFRSANNFGKIIEEREKIMKQNNPNAYSSYFLSNHDMDRASVNFTGDYAKLAASLYLLLPGTPYIYYGEEIGLLGVRKTDPEDHSDSRRRLAMIWSESNKIGECRFPEPSRVDLMDNEQVKIGAFDQMVTNYSLWNHYKKVIQIRNKYPFIKNSVFKNLTQDLITDQNNVLAYELSYGDESIVIIHNFEKQNLSIDVSKLGVDSILDEVSVMKLTPELNGNILKIGQFSTVVLSKKNK